MKAPGFSSYFPTTHTLYCPGGCVSVSLPTFFLFLAVCLLSSTLSIDFCPNHLFYTVPYCFTVAMLCPNPVFFQMLGQLLVSWGHVPSSPVFLFPR
eukprot:1048618-Rhodomonas_salina.1